MGLLLYDFVWAQLQNKGFTTMDSSSFSAVDSIATARPRLPPTDSIR